MSADASAQLGGVAVPRTLSGRRCGRLRRGAGLDECVREAAPAPITKLLDCHGPQYIDLALTFGLNSGAERREGGREAARSVDSAPAGAGSYSLWPYRPGHSQGTAMSHVACGIDICGSGVKGALVALDTGQFVGERVRIQTPRPSTPEAVAQVCRQIIDRLGVGSDVPVGITFPAPIVHGTVRFMANLDKSWEGINVDELMTRLLGRRSYALNDADAAGLAEIAYGAAQGMAGTVIVTTLGTGIGSAVIVDGTLVPNTELGHLEIDGHDAETRASSGQRTLHDMSWKKWAKRLQRYYSHVEMLFSPDLFVVGGGVSKKHEKFLPLLRLRTPIVPAALLNTAGIVGAAWRASRVG